ncbi:A24 family peptidase [Campylobacter sp. MIT 99-7217]|uniref:prepilin peptidase n=1 Tax=Campylobacter sp. MIT 99-7217 TaxID=535091 RepID=UPI00163BAC08|nr:A24 family peptidase [Campylobacter sp. MIT 99-7217]
MIAFFFILGLCVGSFINTYADRFVHQKALFAPRSFCFSCQNQLKTYQILPLFSFIFLRGKCGFCKDKIDKKCFFVELFCGALFILAYLCSTSWLEFCFLSLFLSTLLLLSLIDLILKAVPLNLLLLAFVFALVHSFSLDELKELILFENFSNGFLLYSLCFCGAMFLLKMFLDFFLSLKYKQETQSLGEADIVIISSMAGILGFKFGLLLIFLSACLGLAFVILTALIQRKKLVKIAMIPFLSLAFVMILTTELIHETYL